MPPSGHPTEGPPLGRKAVQPPHHHPVSGGSPTTPRGDADARPAAPHPLAAVREVAASRRTTAGGVAVPDLNETPPAAPTANYRFRCRGLPPGLLRRAAAARYCGAGVSTWDRWSAAGLTPAPVRIGGAVLWSRHELSSWIAHGCPPRAEWAPVWQSVVARRTGRAR